MENIDSEQLQMKMVIVDDDPLMLKNLKNVLIDFGFTVNAFSSPLSALDWVRKHGADMVMTDIVMPKCDGFEVLRQVKDIDPSCEVILLTGHGQIEMAIRALRQGAADFFEKPFDPMDLRAAIERTSRYRMLTQQRNLLSARVDGLSRELHYRKGGSNVMVGSSPGMKEVARNIVDVAASTVTVLIGGESGTGKELVANAIHQTSPRCDKPLFTINCAAIPEALFESEMFGHRRGAFTGATENKTGYAEAADGGTLFLDEIGDLSLSLQAKILRLLEQRSYLPVGATMELTTDIRLIAATNQSLEELVEKKEFRQDLFYRLSVCTINIPPLRDRPTDIPLLAVHLGLQCSSEIGKPIDGIEDDALTQLASYDYPGNVRELRNIIENAVIRCRHGGKLRVEDLPEKVTQAPSASGGTSGDWPLETVVFSEVERALYVEALARTKQNVSAAAQTLGLTRSKLRRRLAALDM